MYNMHTKPSWLHDLAWNSWRPVVHGRSFHGYSQAVINQWGSSLVTYIVMHALNGQFVSFTEFLRLTWNFFIWNLYIRGGASGLTEWFTLYLYIYIYIYTLTYWGRVTHICVNKLTIIGPDLSPGRWQDIIWTNVGILIIWTFVTNFSEILSEIYKISFRKMLLKMSSGKWRTFCLGLNVLK